MSIEQLLLLVLRVLTYNPMKNQTAVPFIRILV
nr:MAG TPA: hypothetical protein [Crassvirales sp.]